MLGISWLGLNDDVDNGVFVWDGTDFPYDWDPNTITNDLFQDFVRMNTDYSWSTHTAIDTNYIICQNMSGRTEFLL